jgi:hypothetical protein
MQKRTVDIRLCMQGRRYDAEGGFRPLLSGPLIMNTGFDKARNPAVLASGDAGPHPTSSNGSD